MSEDTGSNRKPGERRKRSIPVALERRGEADIERRKSNASLARAKSERRRQIDPTTCEREYTDEQIEFMKAMDQYKRDNRRPFPTWSEVLEVLQSMGYRKVEEATKMPGITPHAPPPKG